MARAIGAAIEIFPPLLPTPERIPDGYFHG